MPRNEDIVLQEINKVMDNYIDRVFELSQDFLIDANKVDTSTMLTTANIEREFLHKRIVYPVIYADVVHYGRAIGGKMYSPWLHKWVKRKLGIKDPRKIRSVAYAIAKSIEERGIQPFPFLEMAIDKANVEFGFSGVKA